MKLKILKNTFPGNQIKKYISLLLFNSILLLVLISYLLSTAFIIISGIKQGFYVAMLSWSFFVLCLPIGGSFFINFPLRFTIGSIPYIELITWFIALPLNVITIYLHPYLYFKTPCTHLLYRILTKPNPYWLIIAACAIAAAYRTLGIFSLKAEKPLLYYIINALLTCAGFVILTHLTFHELVIILNIQI